MVRLWYLLGNKCVYFSYFTVILTTKYELFFKAAPFVENLRSSNWTLNTNPRKSEYKIFIKVVHLSEA